MRRLPSDVRDAIWRKLYADADEIDLENLSVRSKSHQYDLWLRDPEIGGELTRYMDLGQARVYIKDSPMKEYARALAGEGSGASFTPNRQVSPQAIVRAALGMDWTVVEGSVRTKPLQCQATNGAVSRYVFWAKSDGLGTLIWAALNQITDDQDANPLIVIRESAANPTSEVARERLRRIAERCNLPLRFVRPPSLPNAPQ